MNTPLTEVSEGEERVAESTASINAERVTPLWSHYGRFVKAKEKK